MRPIVPTTQGRVRGKPVDGVHAFHGIPYAAAPLGPGLFAAPGPAAGWDGVRDAVSFGPTAPTPGYRPPFDELLAEPRIPGAEFLNLNVWTPDPGAVNLPVLVWIHGGGFYGGTSAVPTYDGRAFARDGVVFVSLNYRLGVPGFGLLPDAPANLGLRDQLAALGWVQENIAAFGGDPGQVTIFGESAGAMSVTTLVSVAAGSGLFHRMIAQSGAGHVVAEPADARLVVAEVADRLGVPATAAAFAGVPVDRLIGAQAAVALDLGRDADPNRWGRSVVASRIAFGPVLDGELITERPVDAIAAGVGHDVAVLIGTNTDEFRFFYVPTGFADAITPERGAAHLASVGWDPAVMATYAANRPGASPGEVVTAIVGDGYFRLPAIRLAEARAAAPTPTFLYEFAWRTPVRDLRACHAVELGFVFDTLDESSSRLLNGDTAPRELADRVHAAWVAFARDGDPGWPAYTPRRRAVLTFDSPECTLVEDPRADERALWHATV